MRIKFRPRCSGKTVVKNSLDSRRLSTSIYLLILSASVCLSAEVSSARDGTVGHSSEGSSQITVNILPTFEITPSFDSLCVKSNSRDSKFNLYRQRIASEQKSSSLEFIASGNSAPSFNKACDKSAQKFTRLNLANSNVIVVIPIL